MSQAAATVSGMKPDPVREIYDRQRAACLADPFPSLETRIRTLSALEETLIAHQDEIAEAIRVDFGNRSVHESKLLEIFPCIAGLADTRRKLKKWMRPRRRHVSLWFFGARNRVIPQPKGVVGIVSPWNYPLQLAVSPLTGAVAAGNRCMIKMASHSQNLCQLLQRLVSAVIPQEMVAILPGVSADVFTGLPFDHLIFTGSPRTGRVVMKTAAENLTPVTLELGGKSPTIVAPDYDLDTAVNRILYIKYMNAGQTCVAPDYLFLTADRVAAFVEKARALVSRRYPRIDSPDYTAIISERAFDRLVRCLDDARDKGAKIVNLVLESEPDRKLKKIPPTLVLNVTEEMILMQEEIFGPILPIRTYETIDEVIAVINAGAHPLALYLFTKDKTLAEKVIYNTLSGGVGINDCAVHVAQHDLPFGGVGNSGMGQYHAYEGFLEFSKLRPIFHQAPISAVDVMAPPYGKTFDRLYRFMVRFRGL